jgi:toxin ParE1/3/4
VTAKPTILRLIADQDVDDAINYFIGEGAPQAALEFIDELEQACAHICRHPDTGSARYAH